MIELYLLQQLLAVYECGSLNAAAKHLHLTQPTITRSMQKIEKELGVSLFQRNQNKMTLNDAGILAAKYAKKILKEADDMMQQVRQSSMIQIGYSAPGPSYLLQKIFSSKVNTPDHFYTNEELVDDLRHQKYQMIITTTPIQDLDIHCVAFCHEQLYISTPLLHPLTKYTSLTFEQLDGSTFLMAEKIGIWKQVVEHNMPHSKYLLQDSIDALSQIIISSTLLSFATNITISTYHKEERTYIPVSSKEATLSFYICCLKDHISFLQPYLEVIKRCNID